MKKLLLLFVFALFMLQARAQLHQFTDTIRPAGAYDNIHSRSLYSDSLGSSFVIFIRQEVKVHKHLQHTEHILVLEGSGEMTLGEKTFGIRQGDVIVVPKNTFHGVKTTSAIPLKVISMQAPYFDGKDRVFK